MNVAIISDIHDNLPNLRKALDWCAANGIEAIICPGDVCNAETLKVLATGFAGPVYLVAGNADTYERGEEAKYPNITFLGREGGAVHLEKFTVGICHEPHHINDVLHAHRCDYLFYGHTHKPWEERRQGARVINPGTLGGVFQKATFAVWETDSEKVELKLVEALTPSSPDPFPPREKGS